ncbi:DUF2474 domain-containing protein [Proteus mirabilis]|uniref:DUF2474 domain-containing protein n=1 Tax=Proteus mirabilis TaxID=584 RepID=UPI00234A7B9A|nr:DUF2474 domain-containing protein [Proteus mirabilis]MDC5888866.1 DUF2474 domain-containing protein [Proteus mirabilis]MDC5906463.1 DUF2474 domain-containing protein [Proteus mirabilis]MDC5910003.1 DUF2474 domain-containing protein [Proteus mirabilis]MDC5924114.1 DUF2474 domain-containing protein [Proteus mirabilis]MDC5934643.1 DUF2474 domain-containing protein [Proteus mirabilis]
MPMKVIISHFLTIKPMKKKTRWYQQIGWMIIIWSLSVLSLAIIASLFKLLMYSAGMRTH